ncbi:flagellin [Roseobacter sp. YSTF-M11]|uniref:Flagellin n=1 Tax=Roseobacter insulae TaxID=2859783 RepID=A0A9X1FSP0_9RHOB|nr:flagellin [Roseobacter insulae]MBW4706968.1 flagellin [Roseobacter insulae]
MSSILTNNSAMVALQTLKSINMNLGKVQSEISTGKTVESAKDNAATWAISKVMESDVAGFEAISDSLSLGQATVGVALNAAEGIADLLNEIKSKVVNSQEDNVDRDKIQTDIEALTNQIASISGAAQFNGLNILSNSGYDADSGTSSILSSLDRSATGVTSSNIDVTKQDLSTTAGVFSAAGTGTAANAMTANTVAVGAAPAAAYTVVAADAAAGVMFSIDSLEGDALADSIVVSVNDGDTVADIQDRLITALNFAADSLGKEITFSADGTTAGQINASNDKAAGGAANAIVAADMQKLTGATDDGNTSIGGKLSLLNYFDVTTEDGAEAALGAIEGLIQTSIDSAAVLGSAGKRIETQAEFVGKLSDLLTSGIGALVDADMEAASAKLQALQTQQQLGVQALSIANQAPQTILSLFR